jgi:two-component system sensor histidine kinase RegB
LTPLAHLLLDLLGWSAYVYCSGGASNPLISLLLPLVAIGATILPAWQAWLLGGAAIAAYSYLWLIYLPLQVLDPLLGVRLHLAGMWLTFGGSALVVVWFITRLTATLQRQEAALTAAREQALRQDWVVSLGSLAAGTAHEMSTPLGTMTVLVDELLADSAAAALAEDLRLMRTQLDVCKQSLDRLAAQAGYARGGERGACAVGDWLREQAAAWRTLHPEANIRLELVSPAAGAPSWQQFHLNPDPALAQAIHNLVDNAAAVSPLAVTVLVRLGEEQGSEKPLLQLDIVDQGPGLPPELHDDLGDWPVPSSDGMGIGLFLSRGSIERQGGRLLLRNRQDGESGAEAIVTLPLQSLPA